MPYFTELICQDQQSKNVDYFDKIVIYKTLYYEY
jgi:hypothetical protein